MSSSNALDQPAKDLRSWACLAAGWPAFHAICGLLFLAEGSSVETKGVVVPTLLLTGLWSVSAVGAWRFLRSYSRVAGCTAVVGQVCAGALLVVVAIIARSSELWAYVDGGLHVVAGGGLALALKQTWSRLL